MKEDLRVQKTKAALVRAFYELLAEKSYESITINELCERAEVRRATFYKHYRDKQDFLIALAARFRENFRSIIKSEGKSLTLAECFSKYVSSTVDHITSKPELVKNIIKSQMREPFINVVLQSGFKAAAERINEARALGTPISISTDVAASMIIGGTSMLLIEWFENGMQIPRERLEADIAITIKRILASEKV